MSEDARYVISVACTWHGSIREASTHAKLRELNGLPVRPTGTTRNDDLPCCPHCGSMLMEYASRAELYALAEEFVNDELDGDRMYIAWLQSLHDCGTCRPTTDWRWWWRSDFEAFKASQDAAI